MNTINTTNNSSPQKKESAWEILSKLPEDYKIYTNDPKFMWNGSMRYMFDTCAFIDAITDKEMLGKDVCAILEDWENELCISQETVREVILKYKNKNLWNKYWKTAEDIVDDIRNKSPFTVLPIGDEHLRGYARLIPNEMENHKDPSDHLIIAHAITNRIPLVSRDRKFKFYSNQGLELLYYGR